MKITEIAILDEQGERHTLTHSNGLELEFAESGAIFARSLHSPKEFTLCVAPGRWVAYRVTRE